MGRVQGEIAVARSFGDIAMKNQDTLEPKFLTPEPGTAIWGSTLRNTERSADSISCG